MFQWRSGAGAAVTAPAVKERLSAGAAWGVDYADLAGLAA